MDLKEKFRANFKEIIEKTVFSGKKFSVLVACSGGADSLAEPPCLFHLRRGDYGIELFEVLLLFADIHRLASGNVSRAEHLARPEMGHQRRRIGPNAVLSHLFHPFDCLHQVESRRDALVEAVVARGSGHPCPFWPQLAVDECADAFVCQTIC